VIENESKKRPRRRPPCWAAAALCSLLGACAATGPQVSELERTTAPADMPTQAAWTRQPTATVALGRPLGDQAEQIVGLDNETAMRGDNVLVMRAHLEGGPHLGSPDLEEFLRRNGAFSAPFEAPIAGALRQDTDEAGPFVWAEMRAGGDTLCVLAMRRIRREDVLLAKEMRALDVTLRNCVRGDLATALAPIGPDRIATANTGPGPMESRVISHLAGPRPVASAVLVRGARP
jgi:hypothetical protein